MRHDATFSSVGKDTVAHAIPKTVDREVKPVQVHRVLLRAQIDHAPVHILIDAITEVFRSRPGQAIDQKRVPGLRREKRCVDIVSARDVQQLLTAETRPLGDDEHAIRRERPRRRIDDERADS